MMHEKKHTFLQLAVLNTQILVYKNESRVFIHLLAVVAKLNWHFKINHVY